MVTITEFVLKNKDFLNALILSENPKKLKKLLDNGPELIFTDRTIQLTIKLLRIMTEIEEIKDQSIKTLKDIGLTLFKKKKNRGRPPKVKNIDRKEYEKMKKSLIDHGLHDIDWDELRDLTVAYFKQKRTQSKILERAHSIHESRMNKIFGVLQANNINLLPEDKLSLEIVALWAFFTNAKIARFIYRYKYDISERTFWNKLK